MKSLLSLALSAAVLLSGTASALAQEFKVGAMQIEHPWARASAGPVRNGAAFLVIHNSGDADRLVAVAGEVAERVELHTHIMENDVMKMRRVEAIEVPADGMVALQPGGFHIMMLGLALPLEEGGHFPLTLTFEKAGSITVEVAVAGVGSMGPAAAQGSGTMDHGTMAPAN